MNPEMRKEHINSMIRICALMATKATPVIGGDGENVWYYSGYVNYNGTIYNVRYYTGDCCMGESTVVFYLQGQEIMRVVPIFSSELNEVPFGTEIYADKRMVAKFKDTLTANKGA